MLEALADLGFRVNDPPVYADGECVISAKRPMAARPGSRSHRRTR